MNDAGAGARVAGHATAPGIAAILARSPPRIGPFRIVAALGAGGFAPVFLAVEEKIVDEARALCRVEHPGIVRFYQLLEDGPVLGLAMEHVRGTSLAARLDEEGTLGVEETLAVGSAIAASLAAVHAAGLVHRDVNPAERGAGEAGGARVHRDVARGPEHARVRSRARGRAARAGQARLRPRARALHR